MRMSRSFGVVRVTTERSAETSFRTVTVLSATSITMRPVPCRVTRTDGPSAACAAAGANRPAIAIAATTAHRALVALFIAVIAITLLTTLCCQPFSLLIDR